MHEIDGSEIEIGAKSDKTEHSPREVLLPTRQ